MNYIEIFPWGFEKWRIVWYIEQRITIGPAVVCLKIGRKTVAGTCKEEK